jgi:hypothetical protein
MQTQTFFNRVFANKKPKVLTVRFGKPDRFRQPRAALAIAAATTAAAVLACLPVVPAQAGVNTWTGATGNWADNVGWSMGAPPVSGDQVTLTNLPGAAATLSLDGLALPANLGQLTVDSSGAGSITLRQTDNNLTTGTGILGYSGNGALVQSGGTHSFGNLYLGFLTAGSSGSVSLGGAASLGVSGVEVVGYNGAGSLTQSGGNHAVGNRVFLGVNDGASGVYNLTGGNSTLGEDFYLGWSGANSSGTLNFSGTASLAVVGHEYVGNGGSGTVNHTGGAHSIGGSLFLGNNAGSSGIYNLGPSASLTVSGSETLGALGSGTFNQTGGSHSVGGNLYFANSSPAATGQYTMSGDSSSLTVAGSEILAYNGTGTFNHSGGNHTTGSLLVGINPGSTGTYNLSDSGSLNVTNAESVGAQGGAGTFNQTGGVHTVGGLLTVAATPASAGVYNLSGGTLTAPVVNNGTFAQSGGVFNGTLTNYGAFNYSGGTFAGSLVLQPSGVTTFNAPFTAGGGITVVNSAITVGSSATLTANGTGLNIQGGTLTLTGGSVGGNAPIVNSGQITGNGNFGAGGLNNAPNGSVAITSGSSTFAGAVVNNGSFSVQHGSATFAAMFTNNAAYQSDPSTNTFTDLVNGPTAFIQASDGDQYIVSGSFRSTSAQNTSWDTHSAVLRFQANAANTSHSFDITGREIGAVPAGYTDNFAWGTLQVDPNETLVLQDGNADPGGALYVGVAQLLGAPSGSDLAGYIESHLLNADAGNLLNIYYDPTLSDNAYLDAQTYTLGNGGYLAPVSVPEPPMLGVLAVAGIGLMHRKRRQKLNPEPR